MMRITLIFLAALLGAAPASAQMEITVLYDERSPEEVPVWRLQDDSEALYLRAHDVARIFRATQFWNASSRKVVLGVDRTRFTLTVDTRVVVVDGDPIMLKNPVRYEAGFVMIPLEFVLDIAAPFTPSLFDWDPASLTLYVEKVGFNIEAIAFATTADRSTATITLSEGLVHHLDTSTPGLLRLKVYAGRIDPDKFEVRQTHGLFNGVRAEQTERDAYIYFDISRATTRIQVEREDVPPKIVVVLEKGELPEIPDPQFAERKRVDIIDVSGAERVHMRIERVILDPGHGGKDVGKTGNAGVQEKDVNLVIAKKARQRIERELGLEVVLTREDDRLLSLTRRAEIANESDGDLFISIHCNAWFSRSTGGFEAYFLSPARTAMDRAVAEAENASDGIIGTRSDAVSDIEFILWDMVQNEYINESSFFAELTQKAMGDRLGIRNRGVKQANFTVLQGVRMPAVLIETAFLSNPTEERLLTDDDFQDKLADGIVEAIRRFQERYE